MCEAVKQKSVRIDPIPGNKFDAEHHNIFTAGNIHRALRQSLIYYM